MISMVSDKMPILFINQYYPPDCSATSGVLAKIVNSLSKEYKVAIICGRPSYLPTERYPWNIIRQSNQDNITVFSVGSTAFSRYSILRRILNYLTYLVLALPMAMMIKSRLIIAMTDPPLAGLIGAIAAKIKGKPFIYYIQDLHPDMAIASGLLRKGIATALWDRLHRLIMRSASRIIVIGEDMKERIIQKGIPHSQIFLVRHGASQADYIHGFNLDLIRSIKRSYSMVFMHAGNMGHYGSWEKIVEAIKRLNNPDIGFVFVGEGQRKSDIEILCKEVPNVEFYPYQPSDMLKSVLAAADVQVICVKNGLEGLIVPSKLYSILGAHKPILGICSDKSDVAKIIRQFNCGVVADADSASDIANAILCFYSQKEKLNIFEKNSQKAARFFDEQSFLRKFQEAVESRLKSV
jgi:glycosyltransferase involved in cell wall biosynthesis